jgi:hypothetical protein
MYARSLRLLQQSFSTTQNLEEDNQWHLSDSRKIRQRNPRNRIQNQNRHIDQMRR